MKSNVEIPPTSTLHRIKVIGVGGCGCNCVDYMTRAGLTGPEYFACNSDKQALDGSLCENRLQIGEKTTGGLGCGGEPAVGEAALKESQEEVLDSLKDSDIIFLATGLGGGTGTGASPILAEILGKSSKNKPVVVSVVIMPFYLENKMDKAMPALQRLYKASNSVITIFNDKLSEKMPKKPLTQIRTMADEILYKAVASITDIIQKKGIINIDFADIRTTMSQPGPACIGYGQAEGEDRAQQAFEEAVNCPIMDIEGIRGAKSVLFNITSKEDDCTGEEHNLILQGVRDMVNPKASIKFGYGLDKSLDEGVLRVTIIASGLSLPENSPQFQVTSQSPDQSQPGTLGGGPEASQLESVDSLENQPIALTDVVSQEMEIRLEPEGVLEVAPLIKKQSPQVVKLSPASDSRIISPTKPFNSFELSQQMRLGNKYESNSKVDPVKIKPSRDKEPAFMRHKAD